MTPGLTNTAGENPGTLGLRGRPRFNSYGVNSDNSNTTMMIDGFQIIANNPLPDVGATQEVDVKTFGHGAEVKENGAAMNMIVKSGGTYAAKAKAETAPAARPAQNTWFTLTNALTGGAADLYAANYYGRLSELARRYGMGQDSEAGGPFFFQSIDALQCEGINDIPMGEFWKRNVEPDGPISWPPRTNPVR